MIQVMSVLSALTSLYMIVIMIRIILTWFSGNVKVPEFLGRITDPYLNYFRRFSKLRIGYIDLSPLAAIAVLSIVNQIFSTLARYGVIKLGIILALVLGAVWSVISFLIILAFIVLLLRLIGYLFNLNVYGVFWRLVDNISQPILYRINRLLFNGRIVNFLASLIISATILLLGYFALRLIVSLASAVLVKMPI